MRITKSSGNVFLDIGFSAVEARNLRMRSALMVALRDFIDSEKITQVEAAKRFKVTQPRISDLMRGKISRFSIDTLVKMLGEAGLDVQLRVRRGSTTRRVA